MKAPSPAILLAAVAAALAGGCAGLPGPDRAWPVHQEESLPGDESVDSWLWPLAQESEVGGAVRTILGPFGRVVHDGESTSVHALYPLFTHRSDPRGRRTYLRPLVHSFEDRDEEGRIRRDWAFLPFLLGGSDTQGSGYFLLFPLWGNTRGLLGKDEMRFRLFPLYVDTARGAYRSVHLLWPLVSWGSGGGREDFRLLPFYADDRREGKSRYTAVLWPFLHWREEGLDGPHPIRSFFFFPFYGRRDSDVFWSRTYLFPFFTFAGASDGSRDTNLLWPVFRHAAGGGGPRAFRIWPLFGRYRKGEERSDFYAWPIVWRTDYPVPAGSMRTFQVIPFLDRTRIVDPEGFVLETTDRLWPLFRTERDRSGTVRFTLLDPIPFRGWREFRESYSWLWTLVDHRHDLDGRSSTSLLFGLVQFRREPGSAYAGVPLLLEFGSDRERARFQILKGPAIRLFWFVRVPL
jgi:hypothetical protein